MIARVLFGHVTFLMPIKCPSDNEELTGRYTIWSSEEIQRWLYTFKNEQLEVANWNEGLIKLDEIIAGRWMFENKEGF